MKNWLLGKDLVARKDWGQEEKGTTEDGMVGWHHQLDGHEFEQTPGVGDGQGNLACCSPWGRKESDTTERLNWTDYYRLNNSDTWLWPLSCSWQRSGAAFEPKQPEKCRVVPWPSCCLILVDWRSQEGEGSRWKSWSTGTERGWFSSLGDSGYVRACPSQPVTLRACRLILLVSLLLSTLLEFLFDFCPRSLQQRLWMTIFSDRFSWFEVGFNL